MNWGIIGFGRIAHKFAASIENLSEGKVYAIASHSIDKEDPYIKSHLEVVLYQDYETLLDDPQVDAVYIALPHIFHKEWVIKALEKKVAVLCEKPAVLSKQDMLDIKAKAIENNTFFLEALKTKINVGMDHLNQDLALIGKVEKIEANFCSNGLALKGSNSFLFAPMQGGALNDVGPYLIGFAMDLMKEKVINVTSNMVIVDELDEHFNATLTFENGAKAYLEGAIDEAKERYAIITGEKGKIVVPMFNRIIDYTIELDDGTRLERHFPLVGDDMTREIGELQDCVKQGLIESPRHTMDDSIEIIGLIEKIRK